MAVQIQFRRDTGSNWSTANTVLAEGEMGINTTTNQFKIGNGSTAWNSLSYAPISGTVADLDDITGVTITSAANGDLLKWNGTAWVNAAGYALLASPALTGTPTAPTASVATNTTQVATTAFVRGEVTALVNSATATLDTLGEIATALGNDANLSTTLTTSIGLKAPLASPTFTGTVTLPTGTIATTQTAANNTTAVATTAYVDAAVSAGIATVDALDDLSDVTAPTPTSGDLLKWNGTAWVNAAGYALLASPTFTGTPTLPTGTIATTQTAADNTTAVATTAFVTTAVAAISVDFSSDQSVLVGQIF